MRHFRIMSAGIFYSPIVNGPFCIEAFRFVRIHFGVRLKPERCKIQSNRNVRLESNIIKLSRFWTHTQHTLRPRSNRLDRKLPPKPYRHYRWANTRAFLVRVFVCEHCRRKGTSRRKQCARNRWNPISYPASNGDRTEVQNWMLAKQFYYVYAENNAIDFTCSYIRIALTMVMVFSGRAGVHRLYAFPLEHSVFGCIVTHRIINLSHLIA